MRGLVYAGIIGIAVSIAGCGGSTNASSSTPTAATSAASGTASPGTWTGMGARLSDWEAAHPKGAGSSGSGCSGGGCYGTQVTLDGEPTHQFTGLSTTGPPEDRVDGYEQAIGDGTPLAAAKADVLKLMPSDTRVTAFFVTHENGSCASWNLKSATLGRWFSGKKVGDAEGAIGVDFYATNSNDEPVFDPNNVSFASVTIAAGRRGTSC
jgi:hypothetical protein